MKEPDNYTGVCEDCRKWTKHLFGDNPVIQRKIGHFAESHGHRALHYELHRLYMFKLGIWTSLPAFLKLEEVTAA